MPNLATNPGLPGRWKRKPPQGTRLDSTGLLAAGSRGVWPFNEASGTKVNDLSGYGNRGTLTGGATWVSSSRGPVISFDGSTGYVDCGSSQSLAFSGPNIAFSISLWASIAVVPITTYGMLVTRDDASGRQYALTFVPGNSVTLQLFGNAFGAFTFAPVARQWYHIAATCIYVGSTANVRTYLNGVFQATSTRSSFLLGANTGPTCIGKRLSDGLYFNGLIDQPMILPYALTDGQVQALYQDPWQIMQPDQAYSLMRAPWAILTATERRDMASLVGLVAVPGHMAATEHHDTFAGSATLSTFVVQVDPQAVQVDQAASGGQFGNIDPTAVK